MLANGVKETTATTGTGMVTLSQQSGFVRFSDVFSVGRPVHYAIQDGNNWEWGIGEVGASNTLLRSTILATLSSGVYDEASPSALSLSGSAVVMCAGTTQAMMRPCLIAAGSYINAVTIPANYMDSADFGGLLLTANRTYVHPVLLATAGPIKKLGVEVSTAATGSTVAVGLFEFRPDGEPGRTLAAVEVSGAATGNQLATLANPLLLPPGWYWAGLLSDGAPTIRGTTAIISPSCGKTANRWVRYNYFNQEGSYAPFGATAYANKSIGSPSLVPINNTALPGIIYQ